MSRNSPPKDDSAQCEREPARSHQSKVLGDDDGSTDVMAASYAHPEAWMILPFFHFRTGGDCNIILAGLQRWAIKVGPRLRESRLLAPSGHGPRVHATYSLPYSSALKLTAVEISSLTAIVLISVEFRNVVVNSAIPASFLSKEGKIRWR